MEAFAEADLAELEQDVKPCGFYHTKAKSIKEMAGQLISRFGGRVPDTMDELLSLSGVGRKTANLILGDVYGKPAVVTDTHCKASSAGDIESLLSSDSAVRKGYMPCQEPEMRRMQS